MPPKAVLFALLLAACQPAPVQQPDRDALLARLEAVLPESARETSSASVRTGFADFEAQMGAANPGRQDEIATILNDYADCLSNTLRDAAPRLVIAAADASLSDAEIEDLIAFYSGPDHDRFVAVQALQNAGETLDADDEAFIAQRLNSEAARNFSAAMAETARAFPATEEGRRMIGACTLRMRSAFGRANLTMP